MRIKKLYNNDTEFKDRILKGLPLTRRIFDYQRVFKKGDLVRIREWDGIELNYTYLRREKGFYIFRINREEREFDDEDFDSDTKIIWILRGKNNFLHDKDILK